MKFEIDAFAITTSFSKVPYILAQSLVTLAQVAQLDLTPRITRLLLVQNAQNRGL